MRMGIPAGYRDLTGCGKFGRPAMPLLRIDGNALRAI